MIPSRPILPSVRLCGPAFGLFPGQIRPAGGRSGYTTVREHKARKRVLVQRVLDDTVREERSAHDRMYGR